MLLDIASRPSPAPQVPRVVELPRIPDRRGNLTFAESGSHFPFTARRVYWIYDVPGGAVRGGHAYRRLEEFIVALSGSFDVAITDGTNEWTFSLNRSYLGVYVPSMTWRELQNFSTNSVGLILASDHYDETDYIRDYRQFVAERAGVPQ
jgi:WxcM-like, C-terminal